MDVENKVSLLDFAFRTERDRLRKTGGSLHLANALNEVVQNMDAETKVRLFDLIVDNTSPVEALASLQRGDYASASDAVQPRKPSMAKASRILGAGLMPKPTKR